MINAGPGLVVKCNFELSTSAADEVIPSKAPSSSRIEYKLSYISDYSVRVELFHDHFSPGPGRWERGVGWGDDVGLRWMEWRDGVRARVSGSVSVVGKGRCECRD